MTGGGKGFFVGGGTSRPTRIPVPVAKSDTAFPDQKRPHRLDFAISCRRWDEAVPSNQFAVYEASAALHVSL